MKFYGNIHLRNNEMQQMVLQTEADYPVQPKVGRITFKSKRVWICVLTGAYPIWVPLGGKTDTYVHTQTALATNWIVTHNLNTSTPFVQVYDPTPRMVLPDLVNIIDANSLLVKLNASMTGKVVVMTGDDETYGGVLYPRWTYEHTQTTPSTAWVIKHNLGYAPIVRVFLNDGTEIQPLSITVDSIFQVTVRFSATTAGTARLI